MVNERPGVDFTEIMAVAQEQLADIAAVQRQQAALTATASVADDMVHVTVNARGVVIETTIDPEYLEEYDFDELGQDITYAAQLAAQDVNRRAAALMEPLLDRRNELPALSEILDGAPDLHDYESRVPPVSTAAPNSPERLSLEREPTFPDDGTNNPWHRVRG